MTASHSSPQSSVEADSSFPGQTEKTSNKHSSSPLGRSRSSSSQDKAASASRPSAGRSSDFVPATGSGNGTAEQSGDSKIASTNGSSPRSSVSTTSSIPIPWGQLSEQSGGDDAPNRDADGGGL